MHTDEACDRLQEFEAPEVEEAPRPDGPRPLAAFPEFPSFEEDGPEPTPERIAQRAVRICQDLLDLIGVDAEAHLTAVTPSEVSIELKGTGLGLLIGRHGATLDALQLLVAIAANRNAREGTRVVLDAEQYRERRAELLVRLAHAHAAKARETGKEVVIPDLKPYERRIVHLALQDQEGVTTYSEGEGAMRQLVISPLDDEAR